jgi:hypothetical protein
VAFLPTVIVDELTGRTVGTIAGNEETDTGAFPTVGGPWPGEIAAGRGVEAGPAGLPIA